MHWKFSKKKFALDEKSDRKKINKTYGNGSLTRAIVSNTLKLSPIYFSSSIFDSGSGFVSEFRIYYFPNARP